MPIILQIVLCEKVKIIVYMLDMEREQIINILNEEQYPDFMIDSTIIKIERLDINAEKEKKDGKK